MFGLIRQEYNEACFSFEGVFIGADNPNFAWQNEQFLFVIWIESNTVAFLEIDDFFFIWWGQQLPNILYVGSNCLTLENLLQILYLFLGKNLILDLKKLFWTYFTLKAHIFYI